MPSNTDAITLAISGTADVPASTATSTASSGSIGDFGSCSVPQIEFGVGFDGRKETSFQPVDKSKISCFPLSLSLFTLETSMTAEAADIVLLSRSLHSISVLAG